MARRWSQARPVIRAYWGGDEQCVAARPDFAKDFAEAGGVLHEGPKWTLASVDNTVRGVCGLSPMGEGVWAAWAYLADLTPREWAQAVRVGRHTLAHLFQVYDARRFQAVAAEHPGATRVLAALGFKPSGDHPRLYVMGED